MSFSYFAFVSWASFVELLCIEHTQVKQFVELLCIEHTQVKQFPLQPLSQGDNWMRISIR